MLNLEELSRNTSSKFFLKKLKKELTKVIIHGIIYEQSGNEAMST